MVFERDEVSSARRGIVSSERLQHYRCELYCRRRFPAAPEAIAARRGRSVDVEARTRRYHSERKELIRRKFDGLEPLTPSLP